MALLLMETRRPLASDAFRHPPTPYHPKKKEKKTFILFLFLFSFYFLATFGCWLFHVCLVWVYYSVFFILWIHFERFFLDSLNVATRLVSPFPLSPYRYYVCSVWIGSSVGGGAWWVISVSLYCVSIYLGEEKESERHDYYREF